MILLAWIALVAVAFFAGANFWALVRAPIHLSRLLRDSAELRQVVGFLGPTKLVEEAQVIEPVLGSYAKNIAVWDRAHMASLRNPRNSFLLVGAADLVTAYFVSPWCLVTAGVVLVLPALFPLGNSAKNNNVTHVHTVLLNLIKWHEKDPLGCQHYCTSERPDLSALHSLVVAIGKTPDFRGRIGPR
jgi:hypothetical protein